jgi:hypothetical protein
LLRELRNRADDMDLEAVSVAATAIGLFGSVRFRQLRHRITTAICHGDKRSTASGAAQIGDQLTSAAEVPDLMGQSTSRLNCGKT